VYFSVAKEIFEIGFSTDSAHRSRLNFHTSRNRLHLDFVPMLYRIKLNTDQEQIVTFAAKGHNLLITGQAGVGKSEVIKQIIVAKARGRKIGMICSSGIACQVYDRGVASTVHSFYGLMTAELPWRQLIN